MKTPEERGPFGWWAYEVRTEVLGLSPEQVVIALGKYNPATLRHAEADSSDMSGPLWRALVAYYQSLAEKRGLTLREPPRWGSEPPTPPADLSALVAALTRQAAALEERNRLDALLIETLTARVGALELRADEQKAALVDANLHLANRIRVLERRLPGDPRTDARSEESPSGSGSTGEAPTGGRGVR